MPCLEQKRSFQTWTDMSKCTIHVLVSATLQLFTYLQAGRPACQLASLVLDKKEAA